MATWTHTLGNVKLQKRDGLENAFGKSWDGVQPHLKERIRQGIELAPVMVRCAREAIAQYGSFGAHSALVDADRTMEIGDGLRKYFELHEILEQGDASRWLNGMTAVYGAVAEGLKNPYDIVLYTANDGAKAKTYLQDTVNPGATTASFARSAFGFVDEWGHVDWQGFHGAIFMNMNWVAEPLQSEAKPGEAFARVLVHESTHRWAATKDILYKHHSATWNAKEAETLMRSPNIKGELEKEYKPYYWNSRMNESQRQEAIKLEQTRRTDAWQKQHEIASKNIVGDRSQDQKPLRSINVKGIEGRNPIEAIRWLENADSYSWFARRMWKRAGKPER